MKFLRRIGPNPHENGGDTPSAQGCPDLWELDTGDIAIIGQRVTTDLVSHLPATASCGADEEIVVIPRIQLLKARDAINDLM